MFSKLALELPDYRTTGLLVELFRNELGVFQLKTHFELMEYSQNFYVCQVENQRY